MNDAVFYRKGIGDDDHSRWHDSRSHASTPSEAAVTPSPVHDYELPRTQ